MSKLVKVVVEYNENGYLIYADNYPGAYTRGKTKIEALGKMNDEIKAYIMWAENEIVNESFSIEVVQEKKSNLQICDADSDVIFESERAPLSEEEYKNLKVLVLKSAKDFKTLYDSIPKKDFTKLKPRKTFYGNVPITANEMLIHTNNVTNYYVGEIEVSIENLSDIYENRILALKSVEEFPNYLDNIVFEGSYNELWSLRKVLRRFIWHDRIHAKAMYHMATTIWSKDVITNPFFFNK